MLVIFLIPHPGHYVTANKMKNLINLYKWLSERSIKSEQIGNEIVFTHVSGEISILAQCNRLAGGLIRVEQEPLALLYHEYSGASIGNSHILLGTNVLGGVQLSQGFCLPDLNQMTKVARELGMPIGKTEQVFMIEARWMFAYTIEHDASVIRQYDRDFGTTNVINNPDDVLESWWQMVQADL